MPSAEELKAAIQSRDAEKVRALLRDDPSLAACRLPDGGTPALLAIYYGAADVLEALVTRGVKLDVFEAAAAGDTSRMRVLLDADPTLVSQRSHDGWTPLHLAAHFGRVETMRMLIEHGADVHARSSNEMSNTPLHAAAAGGRVEAVAELLARLLLDRGADASARTDDGITPLDLAEEKSRPDVAALLRERGAEEGDG